MCVCVQILNLKGKKNHSKHLNVFFFFLVLFIVCYNFIPLIRLFKIILIYFRKSVIFLIKLPSLKNVC